MKSTRGRAALWVACAYASALSIGAFAADAGHSRFYVTSAAASLVEQGLAAAAPTGAEAAAIQEVPAPGIRFRANEAAATTSPWVDSNGWRFQRGLKKANYTKLPAGAAPLAAAEAFTFAADAIFNPDPADVQDLGKMLQFLKSAAEEAAFSNLPAMANIGVVDDKSPLMDEVLNMLTRRNLLYRVVPAPDRKLDLTVQLGSSDFPAESAKNPSDFAARVRAKLGDDKRLVRLYGTSTTIAHLTGDGKRARLYLLTYGRSRGQGAGQQSVRIRVLGRFKPAKFAAFGAAPDAQLADVENPGDATEFTVPAFAVCAITDLEAVK